MTRGAMLYVLVLTNKEGLVGNEKLKGSLGCSGQEMMGLKFFGSKEGAQHDFRRAEFDLVRDLLGRVQ